MNVLRAQCRSRTPGSTYDRPAPGSVRMWRRLTSMRTALILLFLLARGRGARLAAAAASAEPDEGRRLHRATTAPGAGSSTRIGMFDVFGSVWFAAIYLLLFISLVGCLIPRIRVHARAMARKPLPAPRNLDRLPESGRFETVRAAGRVRRRRRAARSAAAGASSSARSPSGAIDALRGEGLQPGDRQPDLPRRAARVAASSSRSAGCTRYEGAVIVTQGTGFCNAVDQYDTWNPGRLAAEGKVHPAPFCIDKLTKFIATYTEDGEPTQFRADLTYRRDARRAAAEHDDHRQPPAAPRGRPGLPDQPRLRAAGHGAHARRDGAPRHPGVRAHRRSDAALRGRVQRAGRAGAKQDVGVSGFFAPDPGRRGQRRDRLGIARGRRPGAGDLRLHGRPHRHRRSRTRSTRSTPSQVTRSARRTCGSARPRSSRTASR